MMLKAEGIVSAVALMSGEPCHRYYVLNTRFSYPTIEHLNRVFTSNQVPQLGTTFAGGESY